MNKTQTPLKGEAAVCNARTLGFLTHNDAEAMRQPLFIALPSIHATEEGSWREGATHHHNEAEHLSEKICYETLTLARGLGLGP